MAMTPKAQAVKAKTDRWGHIKFKKLHGKANNQESKKVTYGMAENTQKPYI